MTGAKTSTDERSRVVGSTSVDDGSRHVVASTLRTSSVRQNPIQRTVRTAHPVHNTTQNSSDNLPSRQPS